MEGKLSMTRHFFKVMMPGFQQKLNLPPAFCKKLKQQKSEWAILKTLKGTWKIRICRNCEGLVSFKDGWPKFANHHGLSVGDFVVFEHIGELNFDVLIFDPSACEKEFGVGPKREHEEASQGGEPRSPPKKTKREAEEESFISYSSKNPYFFVAMKPYHAQKGGQVTIPAEFVRSNNLGQKTSIALRDGGGRVWRVKLVVQKTPTLRLRIAAGWHDFYVWNELKEGDVCVFELDPPSITSTAISFGVRIFPANL